MENCVRAEWDEVTHVPLLQGATEHCTSLPGRVWSHRARWADTVVMLECLAPGESWGGQAGGAAGPCVITVHSVCPAVGFCGQHPRLERCSLFSNTKTGWWGKVAVSQPVPPRLGWWGGGEKKAVTNRGHKDKEP